MAQTLEPNGQVYVPLTPPGQSYPEPSHDVQFSPAASQLQPATGPAIGGLARNVPAAGPVRTNPSQPMQDLGPGSGQPGGFQPAPLPSTNMGGSP